MDWFRLFAGVRRASLRDLVRLRIRRAALLLSFNTETSRLLRDQSSEHASKRELLTHLEGPRASDERL